MARATDAPSLPRAGSLGARDAFPWAGVLLIGLGLLALRLAYLAWFCPYTLVEDEAHYWDWSRLPDWSYYSKGPGVAWLIWLMTSLLGESEFGIRAGSALSGTIATIGIAGIAHEAFARRRVTIGAACAFNLIPFYQVGALLMTIDMPYVACWTVAAWCYMRALHGRGRWAWVGLGGAIAIGFLFKYTMALILPGLVIAGWMAMRGGKKTQSQEVTESGSHGVRKPSSHEVGGLHRRWVMWAFAGGLVALLGLLPVLVWNAERDWPTVRHLLGHLGAKGGDVQHARDPWTPLWFLEFVGMQIGLIGPALVLMFRGGGRALRRAESPSAARTLVWMGLPLIVFYLLVSLVNDAEGNWAIAGYLTLIPLAAWFALTGPDRGPERGPDVVAQGAEARADVDVQDRARGRHRIMPGWLLVWLVGVLVCLGSLRLDLVARVPLVGGLVPIGRVMGADVYAASVERERLRLLEETGLEPFVMAQNYGRASQLAFYLPGRPRVYCASSFNEGRKTQFDMWAWSDLSRREVNLELTGRPAVLNHATQAKWERAFELVESLGTLEGETKPGRVSYVGYGYRGFTGPKGN